jgi:signal transduction histidine kinase
MTHEIQVESKLKSMAPSAGASEGTGARQREDFLAVLSHELRTPLHAVLGWVQLLEREVASDVRKHAIAAIKRNASAMCRIVDDLSDQSRINSGKLHLSLRCTDLGSVITDAVNAIRVTADRRGVHIETAVPPTLPLVQADPGRMLQVLSNLLSNAVKFTPSHGRVQIRAEVVVPWLRVVVSDTGYGIDPKLLPHLFVKFQQGENVQARAQGLGLGLPLVKDLVERHGGRVLAESEGLGRGAKFTVLLPIIERHRA